MMTSVLMSALPLWGFEGARYELFAARENAVYRIQTDGGTYALRLHRQGYRTDQELRSELQWMGAFTGTSISVPEPLPSLSGNLLHIVEGIQVDVLSWLDGSPLRDLEDTLSLFERRNIFLRLGKDMARMHGLSDNWDQPKGFTRCAWDRNGLLGETPLWDRFWDNPRLDPEDRKILKAMRMKADDVLAQIEGTLDFGLIHADLVSTNVMVDGEMLHFIDFDDGGFGFRLFDVATSLHRFQQDADYADLKEALLQGYASARSLDFSALDLFLLLRSATYVGWNITRMAEDGAEERNKRFIANARKHALAFLEA